MPRRLAALLAVLLVVSAGRQTDAQAPKSKSAGHKESASEQVIANEKSLYEAILKKDYAAFNRGLGANFTYVDNTGAQLWDLSKSAELLGACELKSYSFDKTSVREAAPNIYVLTYSVAIDQTCNGTKVPSPVHSMSVYQKKGNKWVALAHSESPAS